MTDTSYVDRLLTALRDRGEAYPAELARELVLDLSWCRETLRRLESIDLVTSEVRPARTPGAGRRYYRPVVTATWSPPNHEE